MTEKMLIEAEKYLKTGAHIGTKFKSGDMKRYIFKGRKDGLKVMDIQTIDERIQIVAKFLARYPRERIVIVSRKLYGHASVKEFAESIGGKALTGRFVPGTFTNPEGKEFIEPSVIIATEPEADYQAIEEAVRLRIPVIALASTNNSLKNIDLIIPINNKGRKSLALVYWLLAREFLLEAKLIKKESDFSKKLEDFEYQIKEGEESDEKPQMPTRGRWDKKIQRGKRRGRR